MACLVDDPISIYSFKKKFDVIIALFDVLSYQITNDDVLAFLSNMYTHVSGNGLLIFDCWHGPRVLQDKPHPRLSTYRQDSLIIQRSKKSTLHLSSNTVCVSHTLHIKKSAKLVDTFTENHTMRYFFIRSLISS